MQNPSISSSINPKFFTEKRFIYQEICPRKPDETKSDARERLQCLRDSVDNTKLKQQGETLTKPERLLTKEEIPLMDKSINVIFRLLLQPSFLLQAIPADKRDAAEKAMKLAVEHYDKMQYTVKDGDVVISKRALTNSPNVPNGFKMRIQGGVIKEIIMGKHVINRIGNPRDWKVEWKEMQTNLDEVAREYEKMGGKFPAHLLGHLNYLNYFFYKLPRKYRDMLLLKQKMFPLDKNETKILSKLQAILPWHRTNHLDSSKPDQFYVMRQVKGSNPTPDFMVEFVYPNGHLDTNGKSDEGTSFATFSFDGFLQKNNRTRSSKSFADLYKKKHGIVD